MTDLKPAVDAVGNEGAKESRSVVETLFRFQSVFGLLAVFVAAIIFSPRRNGDILFLNGDNLANVVRAVSEIGIMAVLLDGDGAQVAGAIQFLRDAGLQVDPIEKTVLEG